MLTANWDSSLNLILKHNLHYISWAVFESIWCITHLMVLFGLRNSTLKHLRSMQLYFLLDGITHLFTIINYPLSEIGYFGYINSRYMLGVHIWVWVNLIINPPSTSPDGLRKVYHWSCVEFKDNRFDFTKYWFEIIGTSLDVIAHFTGAVLMMKLLSFYDCLIVGAVTIISVYFGIFWWYGDVFSTEEHMMPETLKSISRKGSEVIETVRNMNADEKSKKKKSE